MDVVRLDGVSKAFGSVRAVNAPMVWSVRGVDRALQAARGTRPAVEDLISRGAADRHPFDQHPAMRVGCVRCRTGGRAR